MFFLSLTCHDAVGEVEPLDGRRERAAYEAKHTDQHSHDARQSAAILGDDGTGNKTCRIKCSNSSISDVIPK